MKRYFLHLCYKGTHYNGWQVQPGKPTVQGCIENSLSVLCRKEISVTGCGRTDSGVHARNFYAHFDIDTPLKFDSEQFLYKLNCLLPNDIKILGLYQVKPESHARFDAVCRHYKYYICQQKEIFTSDYVWQFYKKLDIAKMNQAASMLLNYSDFTSFSKLHTNVKTNNCKIIYANWAFEQNMLVFSIAADRFLRNMVRSIVGTLIEVGVNKITIDDFCKVIELKNRTKAGTSVPASGLFLEKVEYPYQII
jgi:tRNA pseudouridine38-40 synthase